MIENFSDKYPKNQFIQLNKNDVDYFASNLYDLIQNAYSHIGGHIEFSSVDSFKNTYLNFWIASDVDDDPNADIVIGGKYTEQGIKITLGGQDGSRLSIATMISKIKDLMKQKGFYTEMDEELARKVKLQPIEDFDVISKVLENKQLVNLGNGIYERKIGGKWKRKVLVGIPSITNSDIEFADGGRIEKMIESGVVELKMYDTTPEHAKEYGLNANNPLYIQRIFVNENDRNKGLGKEVLQYVDKYAKDNGHDLIFGHIEQKANPSRVKILLEKNGYTTIVGNNDFYKFVGKFAEGGLTYREYADSQFNEEEDLHLPSGYLSDFEIKKSDKKKFPILFKEKNGLEYRLKNDFDSSIRVFDGDKEIGYADNKAIMVAPTYQKKGI